MHTKSCYDYAYVTYTNCKPSTAIHAQDNFDSNVEILIWMQARGTICAPGSSLLNGTRYTLSTMMEEALLSQLNLVDSQFLG